MSHRPTVYGTRHAVSAGHYLAAAAAFSILEAGGNAIDAGCAAGIALGVLQPDLVNVAGVAPIMIRLAERPRGEHRRPRLVAEIAAGRPLHARARRQDPRRRAAHRDPGRARRLDHRAGTPRHDALRRRRALCDPLRGRGLRGVSAARHARSPRTSTNTGAGSPTRRSSCPATACRGRARSSCSPTSRARCSSWPTRTAPPVPIARRGCARRTMRSTAATSRARSLRSSSSEGGYLSHGGPRRIPLADRAGGAAAWRGHEVITCGPWCQGPALLEALALLERVGIAGLPHNSATYLHRIAECVNLAMADREYFFGDPAFVDVPIDHLLNPATIARRASAVRDDRAFGEMPAPLDRTNLPHAGSTAEMPKVEADTSYCCVVDRWGNAFSATPSDGSGNVPVVPGLGITPSGRGSQSRPDPRHPGRRGTGQAAAADAQSGDGGDRGGRRDAVRHAGRRRADPGDAAGDAEHLPARHGGAGRDRGAAHRQLLVPVILRTVRVFPGTAGGRGPHRCGDARRSRRARARGEATGRTGPGWPARSRRCCAIRRPG